MLHTETTHTTIALSGHIMTNTHGIRKLLEWYQNASNYPGKIIYTCCKDLEWLDANLAALWSALIYRLKEENKINVIIDEESLSKRFSILIRNGFSQPEVADFGLQQTFIRNANFSSKQDKEFTTYISQEILQQKQIRNLPVQLKGLLEQNLSELYENVLKHAGTNHPLFICGQFYPTRNELVVSVVDLGQTFLPRISARTEGLIVDQSGAIDWALKGNSEMGEDGGGHALKCIREYFDSQGHALQILTGNGYWHSADAKSLMGAHRTLTAVMPGTMVSFFLKSPTSYKIS
jgi:hypothetical protein